MLSMITESTVFGPKIPHSMNMSSTPDPFKKFASTVQGRFSQVESTKHGKYPREQFWLLQVNFSDQMVNSFVAYHWKSFLTQLRSDVVTISETCVDSLDICYWVGHGDKFLKLLLSYLGVIRESIEHHKSKS